MNFCTVLAMFLLMYQSHSDVPASHKRLAEGGKFLEQKCDEEKKAEEEQKKKSEKPEKKEEKTSVGKSKLE